MYALIRKDLIACRLFLAIGLAVYLLYALTAFPQPLGFFLVHILAVLLLVLLPIVVDDKYQVDSLLGYLPPPRRKIVLARYGMAGLAILLGIVLHYGLGAALSWRTESSGFWTLCSPQAILAFCLLPVTIVALFLPCFFRFGLGRGAVAFAVVAIVLAMILTSPWMAVEWFSTEGGFSITREMLVQPERLLVGMIDYLAETTGVALFYGVVALGTAALAIASAMVSLRFFEARDL